MTAGRPSLRLARGLVFFRMAPYRIARAGAEVVQRPGLEVGKLRDDATPPPFGAEAWKAAGGKWSEDFGGRWLTRGDGRLQWEWLDEH